MCVLFETQEHHGIVRVQEQPDFANEIGDYAESVRRNAPRCRFVLAI